MGERVCGHEGVLERTHMVRMTRATQSRQDISKHVCMPPMVVSFARQQRRAFLARIMARGGASCPRDVIGAGMV